MFYQKSVIASITTLFVRKSANIIRIELEAPEKKAIIDMHKIKKEWKVK